ncbi:hypothetical protein ACFL6U_16250 [Planctomycetota bacterium]
MSDIAEQLLSKIKWVNITLDYGIFFEWLNSIDTTKLESCSLIENRNGISTEAVRKLYGKFQGFSFGLKASNKETLTINKIVYPRWGKLFEPYIGEMKEFDSDDLQCIANEEHSNFIYDCFLELSPIKQAQKTQGNEGAIQSIVDQTSSIHQPLNITPLSIKKDTHCEWFDHTCGNTEAYSLLADIQEILDTNEITQHTMDSIQLKAQELTNEAIWPECPLFCARTIQTMKSLAFIPGAEILCDNVFRVLMDTWRTGLIGEETLEKRFPGYQRVLRPQRVLENWLCDLDHVTEKALPSYLRLLRFKDIPTEAAHLERAITGFVSRIEALTDENTEIAAKVASVFVTEILDSLVYNAPDLAVWHVFEATRLIAVAIRLDPKKVLQKDTGDVRRALSKLPVLLQRAGLARFTKERSYEVSARLGEAYKVLNILHREIGDARDYLQSPFSELIPWLCGRESRPARRNGDGWRVMVYSVQEGGKNLELHGSVVDLTVGGGIHVRWDDRIENCNGLTGKSITVTFRDENVRHEISQVNIKLADNKNNPIWEGNAQALRGGMYEEGLNKPSAQAGSVFKIEDVPDGFSEIVEGLPQRSGLEMLEGCHDNEMQQTENSDLPIITASVTPFESGLEGLFKGFQEFLCGMADEIRLNGYWQALWFDKEHPVKERSIGALLRRPLQEYVHKRNAVLTEQAQSGLGPCDFLIEQAPNKLWIELKPSYGNWRQGMKKELLQYMQNDAAAKRPSAGLFLIFAFNSEFERDSHEVNDLLSIRDRSCQTYQCRIDVAIINCDKPTSASVGETLEKPGDGLQYYEYSVLPKEGSVSKISIIERETKTKRERKRDIKEQGQPCD